MVVLITAIIPFLLGMSSSMKMTDARVKKKVIQVEADPSLEIHEGYVSQKAETILVKQGRKTIAKVHLGEPVMVAQAEQEERWGFFQFPYIGKTDDGTLIVSWQMNTDSHKSYGKTSVRKKVPMMSKDGGKTWIAQKDNFFVLAGNYHVDLPGNEKLKIYTPTSKEITDYKTFPDPIEQIGDYAYYKMVDLPTDLQGIYFNYWNSEHKSRLIHAQLKDDVLLRYSINGSIPVVWWGNIKMMADKSLLAGVYPTPFIDDNGSVVASAVSFYISKDGGKTWNLQGRIPYCGKKYCKDEEGFSEPTFEIMKDSSLICVIRTGSSSPLYKTISKDNGKTWSEPEPFTPNGVKPWIKKLGNGVLVLLSGRPGVQIRFCFDKKGLSWTEPIDMIPFMKKDGSYKRDVSCGYVSLVEMDNNTFLMVYSNFETKNNLGETRKSIWCRKIEINRY